MKFKNNPELEELLEKEAHAYWYDYGYKWINGSWYDFEENQDEGENTFKISCGINEEGHCESHWFHVVVDMDKMTIISRW